MRRRALVGLVAVLVTVSGACQRPVFQPSPLTVSGAPAEGSVLVGCEGATSTITIAASSHLDPTCTYPMGLRITESDVVLDCQGAHIVEGPGAPSRGILITTPADESLANITVRNCVIEGFLNSMRITRAGFKDLPAGGEYAHGYSDVRVEHSKFYSSRGSGLFVDGFVTDVTVTDLEIAGSGGVGIYLEAGSKDNVIEHNVIHNNGYGDVGPEGVPINVGGVELRYESTGREGIAVDGSHGNVIRFNRIAANSAGGIFLYKNCGEDATTRPNGWWTRLYGAEGNLIEGNVITHERNGIWVGSRMAENQRFMDCSDDAYVDEPLVRFHLDQADGNTLRANALFAVDHAVRIEDDDTTVENNVVLSNDPSDVGMLIGTKERTERLGQPVAGTIMRNNAVSISGGQMAYGWVHGHVDTTFEGNTAPGGSAALVPGTQPTINPFLFAISVWMP